MKGGEGVKLMVFWKSKAWNIFRFLWVSFSTQIFVIVLPVPVRYLMGKQVYFQLIFQSVLYQRKETRFHQFLNLHPSTFFDFDSTFLFFLQFFSFLGNKTGDRIIKYSKYNPPCYSYPCLWPGSQKVLLQLTYLIGFSL